MKTGILGGTFDPIHLGHLRAAESAREALGLDRVVFVPAHVPPHRVDPVSSPLDRYAMVALATAGNPAFSASDIELRREGPSYTVDTVCGWLKENPGDSVVVIVGSDTFPDMATWRQPEKLFALSRVVVVSRPGQELDGLGDAPPGTERVEGPALPISATLVRRRAAAGQSVRYLVPDEVAEYIAKRGLYR